MLSLCDLAKLKYNIDVNARGEQKALFVAPKWRDSKVMNKDAIANLQQQIEEEEFKQSFEAQAAERERQRLAKMTPEELAKLAHDKKVREEREAREREEAERKAREELAELLKDEMIRQQREQAEELERYASLVAGGDHILSRQARAHAAALEEERAAAEAARLQEEEERKAREEQCKPPTL